jgi:pimeloyl-ACP methyl ester carboxylesterase
MIKSIKFQNGQNLTLRGFIHEPDSFETAVIFLHGFPASNNYPVSTRIGDSLEKLNYLVLRFEFSGTNSSDGQLENKLMSNEVKDIKYAVDFIQSNYKFNKLILVGYSTGAIDAAIYAYQDSRIDKLVLLGGVGNLKEAVRYDFSDEQVSEFLSDGHITFKRENYWTYNKKLSKAFYDEFFTLDVLGSLSKFEKQVLIVHGEYDEDVPSSKDPIELNAVAKNSRLVIIKNADHKFLKAEHWEELIGEVDNFIVSK